MSPSNSKLGHQPPLEVPDGEVGAEAILIINYEYHKGATRQNRHTIKLFWVPYPSPTPESAQLCT